MNCFIDEHERVWEYEDPKSQESSSVAGNIHRKSEFWKSTLNASKFVTNIIENGYSLPFTKHCPPFFAKNNVSSLKNRVFVEEAIEKLLQGGYVKEVFHKPYCCNPLTVSETKKLRLVLDLRHVNPYLEMNKFKYENLKVLEAIFEKGFYFVTFDLKSRYHHISINPDHVGYLGYSWTYEDGRVRYFVFVVLPFGLATASYVFTKIVRPLVKKWRGEGLRCVVYIDDGIFGTADKRSTAYACLRIRSDLEDAGFTF